jgi:hypothetical protein
VDLTGAPVAPAAAARPSGGAAAPAQPSSGRPDAGARLGHDVATPPSAPPSAPPSTLDLSLPTGGPTSPFGSHGVFRVVPHPPDTESQLAKDIKKSAKPDCREAYANNGLLAVVPLARDAVKGTGCKW